VPASSQGRSDVWGFASWQVSTSRWTATRAPRSRSARTSRMSSTFVGEPAVNGRADESASQIARSLRAHEQGTPLPASPQHTAPRRRTSSAAEEVLNASQYETARRSKHRTVSCPGAVLVRCSGHTDWPVGWLYLVLFFAFSSHQCLALPAQSGLLQERLSLSRPDQNGWIKHFSPARGFAFAGWDSYP